MTMKVFSTTLDISLVYGLILFLSCLVLFSIFEIYYDRRKNVWNINGPFPLPLFGNKNFDPNYYKLIFSKEIHFYLQNPMKNSCQQ